MSRLRKVLLGSAAVYVGSTALAYGILYDKEKPMSDIDSSKAPESLFEIWSSIASTYDDQISWDEFFIGMGLLRRALCKHSSGNVLEISAGTGRNLSYLIDKCSSLTITDQNPNMLVQCEKKIANLPNAKLDFVKSIVADSEHLPFEDNSFDTVVDTFGLCRYVTSRPGSLTLLSCNDPVAALQQMQRVCKPDGKILLLEHGRSDIEWLSSTQDREATRHANMWGCWWNRDIRQLLKASGLHVDIKHIWHLGTTFYIVARPNKNPQPAAIAGAGPSQVFASAPTLPES